MNMWKIYTGDRCTYCTNAKRLLNRENIAFSEHNINMEENKYFLQDKGKEKETSITSYIR